MKINDFTYKESAENALRVIDTLRDTELYENYAINIIIGRMKMAVADYKQYLKDQQKNTKEYWVMVYNNGKDMSSSKDSEEAAIRHMAELREENPGQWDEAYVTKVREVMDNE